MRFSKWLGGISFLFPWDYLTHPVWSTETILWEQLWMRITVIAFVWQQRDFPEPIFLAWRWAQSSFTLDQLNLSRKNICLPWLFGIWMGSGKIQLVAVKCDSVYSNEMAKEGVSIQGKNLLSMWNVHASNLCMTLPLSPPPTAFRMNLTLLFWLKQKQKQTKRESHYNVSHSLLITQHSSQECLMELQEGNSAVSVLFGTVYNRAQRHII